MNEPVVDRYGHVYRNGHFIGTVGRFKNRADPWYAHTPAGEPVPGLWRTRADALRELAGFTSSPTEGSS
ncbi:hypothetical protein [Microbacterium lacus]|uniref:hypothetical protein n=1 Tax=Microbacterium lacus TaxID=415217 RepID=UPI0018E212FB|nr:hypothetical protein [Microbacterium lacus]